jgi:hypothetical protein
VPCPLPRRIERVRVSIASPLMQPSPNGRRVGVRIVTFEACSGFTRVTARRIAQPPKATFVTRLQPSGYPAKPLVSFRTNRQLSGWNPPPQVFRALGAHCHRQTLAAQQATFTGSASSRRETPVAPRRAVTARIERDLAIPSPDMHRVSEATDKAANSHVWSRSARGHPAGVPDRWSR